MFDATLSRQAQTALNSAIGPRYRAEVGSTVIRFTSGAQLALEARNVNMVDQESGQHLSTTGAMRMALDPFALFRGRVAVDGDTKPTILRSTRPFCRPAARWT